MNANKLTKTATCYYLDLVDGAPLAFATAQAAIDYITEHLPGQSVDVEIR